MLNSLGLACALIVLILNWLRCSVRVIWSMWPMWNSCSSCGFFDFYVWSFVELRLSHVFWNPLLEWDGSSFVVLRGNCSDFSWTLLLHELSDDRFFLMNLSASKMIYSISRFLSSANKLFLNNSSLLVCLNKWFCSSIFLANSNVSLTSTLTLRHYSADNFLFLSN